MGWTIIIKALILFSSSRACTMQEGSYGLGLDLGYHVPVGMCGSLGMSECVWGLRGVS